MKLLKVTLVLYLLLYSISSDAQNFSGLQGKELNKIDDASFALLSLGAKRLDGKIETVTVTYDSEKTLKLDISHLNLDDNYIGFKIVDTQKKRIAQISDIKYTQIGADKLIQVEFLLDEALEEGTTIESAYLQIDIKKSKSNFLPTSILYSLDKTWKTEINAENLIIPIKLEPIGSAKKLRADNRVFVRPYKKPILKGYPISTVRDHRNSTSSTRPTSGRVTPPPPRNTTSNTRPTPTRASGGANVHDHRTTTSNTRPTSGRVTPPPPRNTTSNSRPRPTRSSGGAIVRDHRTTTSSTRSTSGGGRTSQTNTSSDKKAQGPDNLNQISLWDNLATDIDFEFPFEITNIQMNIYPDKNLNSGVFYYLPNAYHLQWDTNAGYQFNMLYGTAESSEISGDVSIAGVLTPGISKKESDLIKALLNSYVENNKSIYTNKNIDLKILPIKSTPSISLSEGLQNQYKISEEDINVTISSTINNPINVSWVVDNRIKEEIQVALSEGVGIHGTMVVVPDSENIPEQLIPVRIALSDTRTIGKLNLQPNNWRNRNWVNQTPFPLKLKYVHALVIGKDSNGRSLPMVYSWSLNNTVVPSKSQVKYNGALMPKWIESKTERIWIDYSIDECNSCVDKIMDEVTGGTSGSKTKTVNFKSFKIFEDTKASSIEIYVKSLQADPKGENVIRLTRVLEKDLLPTSVGPFYLAEGVDFDFEYKLKLIMSDGVEYIMDDWQPSHEENVNLGMHTLKETISNFPEF